MTVWVAVGAGVDVGVDVGVNVGVDMGVSVGFDVGARVGGAVGVNEGIGRSVGTAVGAEDVDSSGSVPHAISTADKSRHRETVAISETILRSEYLLVAMVGPTLTLLIKFNLLVFIT